MNNNYMPRHDFFEGLPCVLTGFIFIAIAVITIAVFVITAIVWCKIVHRTGYHWALGLLRFVPIANFIILLILAFSEWPVQKEVRRLREEIRRLQSPPTPVEVQRH